MKLIIMRKLNNICFYAVMSKQLLEEQDHGGAIELLKRISSESMCSVVADEWIHEFLNSQHLTEQPTRELSEEELLEKAEELSAKRQYSDQGFQIYITGFEDCYKLLTQTK